MSFSVTGLVKSYSGVAVLRGVDLTVERGEIHALLGANGAGKSTLIKCLVGAVEMDGGAVTIDGERVHITQPRDAKRAGIEVVHQEPSLAASLNAAENVFLGREPRRGPFLRRGESRKLARKYFTELGIGINPTSSLAELSNADLQMIEIVKALSAKPKFLILDEPTAALTEVEQRELAQRLKELRSQNLPILYVTHRLSEVFEIADTVTVLWGGQVALSASVSEVTEHDLVEAIIAGPAKAAGKEDRVTLPDAEARLTDAKAVLEFHDVLAPKIGPVSLTLRSGEIVGVYGLVGSGRTELLETIAGAHPWVGGSATLDGSAYRPKSPSVAVARGVALVPSDRLRKSMFPGLSALDNCLMPTMRDTSTLAVRHKRRELGLFNDLVTKLRVRPAKAHLEARRYSGGNQQKLVLSRWLTPRANGPVRVMLLDEPTDGVDVGARQDLYRILRDFVKAGSAALVASSEPEELMQLADRVLILSSGRPVAVLDRSQMSVRTMTRMAHFNEIEEAGH